MQLKLKIMYLFAWYFFRVTYFRGFFYLIKSLKRMCISDYVKNRIGTCKNVFFGLKKRYKQINVQDIPKHTALFI